jgi:AcrR family transcriptional regulator
MPNPRFDNLPEEKRRAILEAAATEFGSRGYGETSLNQVLAAAGLSKGVAYYYFHDKADLFETVVHYFLRSVGAKLAPRGQAVLDASDAEAFWQGVRDLYVQSTNVIQETPWMAGLMRECLKLQPPGGREGPLARLTTEMRDWMMKGPLRVGQRCGAIRTDLPNDLLMDLALAIDQTLDRWLAPNLDRLSREELASAVGRYGELLRRVLEPRPATQSRAKRAERSRR